MSIHGIYRICIWLPIIVPVLLVLIVNALGLRLAAGVVGEMLAYSLIWGGLPYAALALWATRWIDGRPEAQIRHLMFRAPPFMAAVFVPFALLLGLVTGALGPFVSVALLGAATSMLLGYAYVAVAVLLRIGLGPRGSAA